MSICSFCGKTVSVGSGVTMFKRDGTALYFCSRKCEKNISMGRNPARFKWTEKYSSSAKKKK